VRPNQAARIAAVILAVAGLSAMLAGGLVATHAFTVRVPSSPRIFKCGSVLFPKDPRNKVSSRASVPPAFQRAYNRCQNTSSNRVHTATTFLLVGVVPLLIVLTLPALSRRSRRSRARRRTRL
jgi:heme A synthase